MTERWTRHKGGNTGRVPMPSVLRRELQGPRVVQPWDPEALGEQARVYDITKADRLLSADYAANRVGQRPLNVQRASLAAALKAEVASWKSEAPQVGDVWRAGDSVHWTITRIENGYVFGSSKEYGGEHKLSLGVRR